MKVLFTGSAKKNILQDISAAFLPGQFNVILGPNGSGKSSLLKILSGYISEFAGQVFYDEKDLQDIPKNDIAKFRAVMSQQPELSFPLSVEEVVMMGRYPHFIFNPGKKDIDICREVMERLNLAAFAERNYLSLSGGEKQRVQFARVLAQLQNPNENRNRYLFLDEPIASLDLRYQHELLHIAKTMAAENIIVIAVLHDINLAIQYGDRIFFMKEGKIVVQGTPAEVISADLIYRVFNVPVKVITGVGSKPFVIHDGSK